MTVGENINDYMRDEYRSAARNAPVWREPQPPTRDDLREPDEWGDQ
jgi:hypothetical protein